MENIAPAKSAVTRVFGIGPSELALSFGVHTTSI